ncbi:hypothetical protein [Staphylococcus epidermidis]|uniref:hypothetical protein n=1 Tax=Staphylococcus epidermidis TaxID=1282 RepID=UPI0019D2EC12|nr:hypothetical protein [Staphylococcus epidermidis]MBN6836319.1 hypothetical protein [Staphylococcus epidermidis]MCG1702555.1 hypothetical protein [Staphylococcus epidermidis]MCG2046876.1 hypothetical protein [Staphylococcus epidermidis]
MIQIFRKRDGKPFLIDESKEGYDKDLYTDIMPPSNLYLPVKFDGGEWVGTPYEEWKKQQVETVPPKKDDETHKDQIIADLSLELLKTQEELKDVHKDISDLTIQLLGGATNA